MACGQKELGNYAYSHISAIRENNLVLGQSDFGAGEGPYKSSFLCAELVNEDIP
jgi:hypothetical protein